jgi:hypothetical protein
MLRGRTPEQLRQEARAWVDKIFGPVGGQPVRGDLDKLFRDEDVSDVIPF